MSMRDFVIREVQGRRKDCPNNCWCKAHPYVCYCKDWKLFYKDEILIEEVGFNEEKTKAKLEKILTTFKKEADAKAKRAVKRALANR